MNEALLLKREEFDVDGFYGQGKARINASVYCMFPPYEGALFCRVSTNKQLVETMIFSCDDQGEVTNWTELWAEREVLPHDDVIRSIGYQISKP